MTSPNRGPFEDAPVIFSYTRAEALEDGVLVDLTPWAKETGFVFPVACTSVVWNELVTPSGQDIYLAHLTPPRATLRVWEFFEETRRRPRCPEEAEVIKRLRHWLFNFAAAVSLPF